MSVATVCSYKDVAPTGFSLVRILEKMSWLRNVKAVGHCGGLRWGEELHNGLMKAGDFRCVPCKQ